MKVIVVLLTFIIANTIAFFINQNIYDEQLSLLTYLFSNIGSLLLLSTVFHGKVYRRKEEHGSAVFMPSNKFQKLKNKKEPQKSIILAENVTLSLDHRKVQRNLNVLVAGVPGTGKTQFVVNPNLCQLSSSFVVTDPKGEILAGAGTMLKSAGYKIKVLNLVEMNESDFYNPFKYLRKDREEDVLTLIDTIVKNTDGPDKKGGDPFWENAEKLFLQALFFYVIYEEEEHRQTIGTIVEYLSLANYDGENENELDIMFAELEEKDPLNIAVINYKMFKTSAKETLRSIVITANARFGPFAIKEINNLFSYDTMELHKLDDQKTALFLIISPMKTNLNFIGAMFYTQVFSQLDYIANWVNKSKGLPLTLKIPMLFILDEFANIGKIPDFERILAYARSLNIGIMPIIQNLNQLKEMYKDSWETIVGSCDSFIFLGGNDNFTLEYLSKKIGKQTIDNVNRSRSKGKQGSSSTSEAILGRDLMTPDEIALMPFEEMLLFVKGYRTHKGKKYNVTKHKNYKKLGRGGNKIYIHKIPKKPEIVYVLEININELLEEDLNEKIDEKTEKFEPSGGRNNEEVYKNGEIEYELYNEDDFY